MADPQCAAAVDIDSGRRQFRPVTNDEYQSSDAVNRPQLQHIVVGHYFEWIGPVIRMVINGADGDCGLYRRR